MQKVALDSNLSILKMVQKVAVIGAGASGLTSIKAAVEEGNICKEFFNAIGS